MNRKDILLAEKIIEEIRGHRTSSMLIFNTNFTQIGKTNLLLLKGFLDIEKDHGFFIAVDRPHQYMSYLLSIHDVNQENLWFIDTVTHTSGLKKKNRDNVNFLDDLFHIERLLDDMKFHSKDRSKSFLPLEKVDFFLMDNLANMLNYNHMDKVEEFIKSLCRFHEIHSHIVGAVTVDKESNPELSEILIEYFDYMVDIEELKKEVDL